MIPLRHLRHQGPVLASLARTALSSLKGKGEGAGEVRQVLSPRPPDLVRDYVREVGGDPAAYRESLPAHFFCQWGFPAAARSLVGQPYPLHRALNAGCRLEVKAPLPAGAPLLVTARLEEVDENDRRVLFRTRVETGTEEAPAALVSDWFALLPQGKGKGNGNGNGERKREKAKKERVAVPAKAREVAYWKIGADAGLAFGLLTGDMNPLHWARPYARAMGFSSTILHGFATMARAWEGLTRTLYAGDPGALRVMDVRFTRPLVLPARVGLYVDGNRVLVGDAPGGPVYLDGTFEVATSGEEG